MPIPKLVRPSLPNRLAATSDPVTKVVALDEVNVVRSALAFPDRGGATVLMANVWCPLREAATLPPTTIRPAGKGLKKRQLRRNAVIDRRRGRAAELCFCCREGSTSTKGRQHKHAPLGRLEFGCVGRILEAVQMRIGERMKAHKEWRLSSFYEA